MRKILSSLGLLGLSALSAQAALTGNNIRMAIDVPTTFRGSSFAPSQSISAGPNFAGPLMTLNIAGAERVGIDALAVRSNIVIFSTDVDFHIGTTSYADEDVLSYNYSTGAYSLFFKGSTLGIPEAADVDAIAFIPGTTNVLISFDTTTTLPGAGVVRDDDVVLLQNGVFSKFLDGATNLGLPAPADIDGLYLSGSSLYYSLDTSFKRGALAGTDKDIWVFNTNTLATTLVTGLGLGDGVELRDMDELVDTDGDGLSDLEEITALDETGTTFPGTTSALSPSPYKSNPNVADSDGDGIPDGAEAGAGTNPTNNTDYLRLTAISPSAGGQIVRWTSVGGKQYDIESAAAVTGFSAVVADNVNAAGATTEITNAPVADILFYRVRVQPQ